MKILIGGDFAPFNINEKPLVDGDIELIFRDLLTYFWDSEITVLNLECPLLPGWPEYIHPRFVASEDTLNGITKAGIDIVNLANNHILDQGKEGLINTVKKCDEYGLKTVGAGEGIENARKPVIITSGEKVLE